jgi:hypothetical protein
VATVDEFVQARVQPEHREIVARLRTLMKEHAPSVRELISYGIPAFKAKRILAVISPTKKDITLAFSRGAEFEDKYGLLSGVGKVSKHVKIGDLKQLNAEAIRYYVKQTLELDSQ